MRQDPGTRTLGYREDLIFDIGSDSTESARSFASEPPHLDVPDVTPSALFGSRYARTEAVALPTLCEPEVVRHFTRLSSWNFDVDHGFYPLGSCTMKYNPKVNEWAARLPGFADLHPYMPETALQGVLALMVNLEQYLAKISGMAEVSLQPAAGAHGELTALMIIKAALKERGDPRKKVLIPDTAHGTNPASARMNGYTAVPVNSTAKGHLDPASVAAVMTEDVAALMLTNPNTLGLFEKDIVEICRIVHDKGGYVFGDGANLNAIMGYARPGDFGIDAMHFNLHKTFSAPHGGGGPGSGPVGVVAELAPFLPIPRPVRTADGRFVLECNRPLSIGRVRSFLGNVGVMIRAYTYIRELGAAGVKAVSEMAVLNANYLLCLIKDTYPVPYGEGRCMHEVVASDKDLLSQTGVSALDVAKALIDKGYHPPTIYFPLVVKGALMCEPTETESVDTIDGFAQALVDIAHTAHDTPEHVTRAPQTPHLGRLDEASAARHPILTAPRHR